MIRHLVRLLALATLAVGCSKPPATTTPTTANAEPQTPAADALPKAEDVLAQSVEATGIHDKTIGAFVRRARRLDRHQATA